MARRYSKYRSSRVRRFTRTRFSRSRGRRYAKQRSVPRTYRAIGFRM